jgi:hypothetical protein
LWYQGISDFVQKKTQQSAGSEKRRKYPFRACEMGFLPVSFSYQNSIEKRSENVID